jgi:hypothetical protein
MSTHHKSRRPLVLTVTPDEARAFLQHSLTVGRVSLPPYRPPLGYHVENVSFESPPDQDPGLWLRGSATAMAAALPQVFAALAAAARDAEPAILLRGLAADAVAPATPYDGRVDVQATRQSIVNVFAVIAAMGLHPVCYAAENMSLLHAVVPSRERADQLSSRGFRRPLPWHSDYADRPFPGPFAGKEPVLDASPIACVLAFSIVRDEPGVPMEYVETAAALAELTPAEIRTAMTEAFATAAPSIFGGKPVARLRRLIAEDGKGGLLARFNQATMSGQTPAATALLARIGEILEQSAPAVELEVQRGDVVVFNNLKVLHRRSAFAPRFDGTDRYFIRVGATTEFAAGIPANEDRPWIWR